MASRTGGAIRSEEHTSELQSRPHLVCRLLLEKKKLFSSSAAWPATRSSACRDSDSESLGPVGVRETNPDSVFEPDLQISPQPLNAEVELVLHHRNLSAEGLKLPLWPIDVIFHFPRETLFPYTTLFR